ncbi:thioesterase domain-containing protein [Kitasatospora sp. LaBMicrA B282]|uniref:thioesterase domain-containing protein n=1 Tax=Kitasatospora sp. LaBMicrA B282 TaxID=3420949 RepID=UPI003D0B263D
MAPTPSFPGFDPLLELAAGTGRPLWCVHPAAGIAWEYLALAPRLPGVPLLALQAAALQPAEADRAAEPDRPAVPDRPAEADRLPESIEQLADHFTGLVRSRQPSGPYRLLGWSFGGLVAHAVAHRLRSAGEPVELLALLDGYPYDPTRPEREPSEHEYLTTLLENAGCEPASLVRPDGAALDEPWAKAVLLARGHRLSGLPDRQLEAVLRVFLHHLRLRRRYTPPRFDGDLLLVRAAAERTAPQHPAADWAPYLTGRIEAHDLPTEHRLLLRPEPAERIGRLLAARLAPAAG